jgi:hypothetical protein
MCDEIGEEGTYHTHLYFATKNGILFSRVKKLFDTAHIEQANGTHQQNKDYIRKEGKWAKDKKKETNIPETYEEFGEMPIERQGYRNDLAIIFFICSCSRFFSFGLLIVIFHFRDCVSALIYSPLSILNFTKVTILQVILQLFVKPQSHIK